ncbi:BET1-like protein [Ruditapes philippinarum]|uniref:BET1-like protein n=1 Tax=Ruditapes philippinarum TaxID=129788 RepID=UPI00295C35B3|nr:BET1-like protein [Ruditapes philippinarum]
MADWNRRNGTGRTEEMLDSENQSRVEGLAGKISRLKGIALDIETETKHQNTYMDNHMMDEFDSSQGLLTGSMNRINHMVSSGKGNRKLMCYIIIGLIILFFLSYYLITKVTSG